MSRHARYIQRLAKSVEWSGKEIETFRRHRKDAINEYLGPYYSGSMAKKKPLNLLQLTVNILVRNLVAHNPQVKVYANSSDLNGGAYNLGLALSEWFRRIGMKNVLARVAKDAIFSMGIIKMGWGLRGEAPDGSPVARPFIDTVSLDDFIPDMTAKSLHHCQWYSDGYEVPLEWAQNNPAFNKDVREKLKAWDESENPSVRRLGRNAKEEESEYEPRTKLRDVYLASENVVVTYADGQELHHPLNEVDYDKGEKGPYHFMYFDEVLDCVMPLPKVQLWRDMDEAINKIQRKIVLQAERQKKFLAVRAGMSKDGKRMNDILDGETKVFDDPDRGVQEKSVGGPDNVMVGLVIDWIKRYNWLAGNIDAVAGLGPLSETASQDKMMSQAANQVVEDMQDTMMEFTQEISTSAGELFWNDAFADLPFLKPVPMAPDVKVAARWTPEMRTGEFTAYNFEVVPYSMRYESPAAKLNKMLKLVTELMGPLQVYAQQQGVALNVEKVLRKAGDYLGIKEIDEIITFTQPQELSPQTISRNSSGNGPKRQYEHINRSVPKPGAADDQMVQELLASPSV